MFRRLIGISIVSVVVAGCATSSNFFKLRQHEDVVLSNGLKVILVPDASLPYFSMNLLVKAGAVNDPEAKDGLASLVANLLEKGTEKRSATELATALEQIGASFSASADHDYTMVSASGLSYHEETISKLFAEVVVHSRFSDQEISRLRRQRLSELKKLVDEPSSFASVAFQNYLFDGHPYAQSVAGRVKTVSKIRRKDVIRFYLKHYRPNNSILAVSGNFPKDMKQRLEVLFKDWKPRNIEPMAFPPQKKIEGLNIRVVDNHDLKQTQIRFGHYGIKRTNPDYLTLRVANTILGGAFASRLVEEVRVKRGLTYSIGSQFEAQKDPGAFRVSTFTRHDKIGETVSETLRVLSEMREQGVTKAEVEEAIGLMKGRFPRAIETSEGLAQNLMVLEYYGLDDSYLKDFLSDVDSISVADVNRVVRKYLDPSNMRVLVYSNKAKALSQLKGIGKTDVVNFKNYQ